MEQKTSYDKQTKVFTGIQCEKNYTDSDTLGKRILDTLLQDPDHIHQICAHNGGVYTNRAMASMTISIARHLKKLAITESEVIGVFSQNNAYVAPILFAAMLLGIIVSPMDTSWDDDTLKHLCSITKPKIVFCEGNAYHRVNKNMMACQLCTLIFTIQNHIEGVPNLQEFLNESSDLFELEPPQFGLSKTVAIVLSSGTKDLPKCVGISREGVLRSIVKPPEALANGVVLCFSEFQYLPGFSELVLSTIAKQTRLITEDAFSPQLMFQLIKKYKVNTIFAPPSAISLSLATPEITKNDLSSVRAFCTVGTTVAPQLVERMKQFMKNAKFYNGYSLTEANGAVVSFGEARPDGGIAPISFNMKVKIINNAGKPTGPGDVGEICIYQSVPWPGYYNNPEATAQIQDAANWLHSGDAGYISIDGILFVTDRKEDLYKFNEYYFSPIEIENSIYHLPDVLEVCAFGIPYATAGYLPAAAVTLRPGSGITEKDICDIVALKMPPYKHLFGGGYILCTLAKTANGRIKRREIALQCEELSKSRNLAVHTPRPTRST